MYRILLATVLVFVPCHLFAAPITWQFSGGPMIGSFTFDNSVQATTLDVGGASATYLNVVSEFSLTDRTDLVAIDPQLGTSITLVHDGIRDHMAVTGFQADGSLVSFDLFDDTNRWLTDVLSLTRLNAPVPDGWSTSEATYTIPERGLVIRPAGVITITSGVEVQTFLSQAQLASVPVVDTPEPAAWLLIACGVIALRRHGLTTFGWG